MSQRLLSFGAFFVAFLVGMGVVLPFFDRREYIFSSEYVGLAKADSLPVADDPDNFWNYTTGQITPTINYSKFWNYIKNHITYTLSIKNTSNVVRDITSRLTIGIAQTNERQKLTYTLNRPYTGKYYLNFSIDNPGVSFSLDRVHHVVNATYTKNDISYVFSYNYTDLLGQDLSFYYNINSTTINFGMSRTISGRGTTILDPIATVQTGGVAALSTFYNTQRKICRTSNGRLVCVYAISATQINLAHSSNNGSTWTTLTASPVYTTGTRNQTNVSCAIDANNIIHFVWNGQLPNLANGCKSYVIRYRRYFIQNNTMVASIQNISVPSKPFCPTQQVPCIAIDSTNKVHLVWYGNSTGMGNVHTIRYCTITNGVISSIQNFSREANSSQTHPSIAIDGSNNVHIAFRGNYGGAVVDLRYRKWYSSNSTWNTKIINITSAAYQQNYPSIVVNNSNYIHIVWYSNLVGSTTTGQIRYTSSADGKTFSVPISLTNVSETGSGNSQYRASISFNDSSLHVVWFGLCLKSTGTTTAEIIRVRNYSNGVWQPTTNLTHGTGGFYNPNLMCANWPIVLHNQTNVPRQGYCGIFANGTTITYFNTTNGKANPIWSSRVNVLEAYPTNMTTNIQREPFHLKVKLNSPQGAKMNITWFLSRTQTFSSATASTIGTNTSVINGTYMCMLPTTLNWSEHYYWKVTIRDGHAGGGWNSTYWFVTRGSGRDKIIWGNETWGYDDQNVTQLVKTTGTTYVNTPVSGLQMVRSRTGKLFVVFNEVRGKPANQSLITIAWSNDNGSTWPRWQTKKIVENRTGGKYYQIQPSMAIDSNDVIHIAWAGQHPGLSTSAGVYFLRYRKFYVNNLSYSVKIQNFSCFRPYGVNFTDVCVDKKDNVYISYASTGPDSVTYTTIRNIFYNATNNSWGNADTRIARYYNFSLCGSTVAHSYPTMACDTNNVIHLAWQGGNSVRTTASQIMYRRFFGANRTWSPKIVNITGMPSRAQTNPSIVIDGNNEIHLAWQGNTNLTTTYYVVRYVNLTTTRFRQRTLNLTAASPSFYSYYPSLSINGTKGLRIVFASTYVGNNLAIQRLRIINRTDHGVWGRPTNLTASGLQCYQAVSVYANYPIIKGNHTNIPCQGVACTFFVQYADGLLHYYNTSNLVWQQNRPTITGHHPTNLSTGIVVAGGIGVRTYVNITDIDANAMSLLWSTNVTGKWLNEGTVNTTVANGTYYHTYAGFSGANTKYFWKVNVTDNQYKSKCSSNVTATYYFTTAGGAAVAPTITDVGVYKNQTLGTPLRPTIFFWANDTDSANLVVNIYTNGSGIWLHSQKNFSAGMPGTLLHYNYSSAFDGGKRYYYNISVFDGTTNISRFFWFQTRYPVTWAITSGWNVSFKNHTIVWQAFKQKWNISFKNSTSYQSLKQKWNVSFRNATLVWQSLKQQFNISFRNQTNIQSIKKGWNVSFKNGSGMKTIRQNFNISFKNTTIVKHISQNFNVSFKNGTVLYRHIPNNWNVSFRNTSTQHMKQGWNVSWKNKTAVFNVVKQNFNISFKNITIVRHIPNNWNISFRNTSVNRMRQGWNISFRNSSLGMVFHMIQGWNVSFRNTTVYRHIPGNFNISFKNVTVTRHIPQNWNVSWRNSSVQHMKQTWNVSFKNGTIVWQHVKQKFNISWRNSTVIWKSTKYSFNVSFKNGSYIHTAHKNWNVSWRNSSLQNLSLECVYPANESTGIGLQPILVINISQVTGKAMTVHWMWGLNDSCTESLGYSYHLHNGTHTNSFDNATAMHTKYYWKVILNDTNSWENGTFHFTTVAPGGAPGGGGGGGSGSGFGMGTSSDSWWPLPVGILMGIVLGPIILSKRREDDEEDEYEEED